MKKSRASHAHVILVVIVPFSTFTLIISVIWYHSIPGVSNTTEVHMRPGNYVFMSRGKTIFVTNIFLKFGNLALILNHITPESNICCYYFKIKSWKMKIKQFYIHLETFLIRTLVKPTSSFFKDLIRWRYVWEWLIWPFILEGEPEMTGDTHTFGK